MGLHAQAPDPSTDTPQEHKGSTGSLPAVSGLCLASAMRSAVSLKCPVCAQPSPGLAVTLRPALVLRWLAAGEEGGYVSGEPEPRGLEQGRKELATDDEQDRDLQGPAGKEG